MFIIKITNFCFIYSLRPVQHCRKHDKQHCKTAQIIVIISNTYADLYKTGSQKPGFNGSYCT